jgi:hypothetical protein
METTGFVHETTESKTKVKLGVGVHQLTLTVIDDAGMMSEPDTVVVTVERVGLPQVNHIDPDRGRRGEVVDVVVVGANLQDATAVKVYRGDEEDPRIRVTIRPGATQDKLPITLTILDHAGLGARLLEVVTARGVATAKFTVVTEEKAAHPEHHTDLDDAGRPTQAAPRASRATIWRMQARSFSSGVIPAIRG